jgi:hypothetical protein
MSAASSPSTSWPASIVDEAALDDLLSTPTPAAVDAMRSLRGDVIVLGVAGKMGPTLARMVRRATDLAGVTRRVIGVSRFTEAAHEEALRRVGVDTIRCDLLDESAVAALPDAPNVIYMAGRKFGSSGLESLTWAMNAWLPAVVCKDRGLLDGQRVRPHAGRARRVARGRRAGAGGRVRHELPGA